MSDICPDSPPPSKPYPDDMLPQPPSGYMYEFVCTTKNCIGSSACPIPEDPQTFLVGTVVATGRWFIDSEDRPPNPQTIEEPTDFHRISNGNYCGISISQTIRWVEWVLDTCPPEEFDCYSLEGKMSCKTRYTNTPWLMYDTYQLINCEDEKKDFPEKNQIIYLYSGEWCEDDDGWEQNNQYCANNGGTLETSSNEDCLICYRCKYLDENCTDIPFPPKEKGDECKFSYDDCEPYQYSEPWCCDYHACGGGTAGYTESHDCVGEMLNFGSYWIDGKRVSYYSSDGEIETAYIDCKDMCRCKYRKNWRYYPPKLPYYTPPGTPGGKWIENPPPEDPPIPGPPFNPKPIPPTPCPPCHPCPKPPPLPPGGCCNTSDNDIYEWCDCDIVEDVPTSGGCFEKPINKQTTHCCDFVSKDYKQWVKAYDYYNEYDSLYIE